MKLCEAMKEASSEQVVFFLTTAYVETLQHSSFANPLPVHVTTLPLNGMGDLRRRRDVLQALIAMYYPEQRTTGGVLEEAYEVFEAALERLRALNAEGATAPSC